MERLVTDPVEKQWGMLTHIASFAAFVIPFGNIVGPLLVYLIKKDEHEFVNDQGKEVLNFQITWSLIFILSGFMIIVGIGILMLIGFGIAWFILVLMGTIKANEGLYYRYPLSFEFIK